jgi:hypothetical protein
VLGGFDGQINSNGSREKSGTSTAWKTACALRSKDIPVLAAPSIPPLLGRMALRCRPGFPVLCRPPARRRLLSPIYGLVSFCQRQQESLADPFSF